MDSSSNGKENHERLGSLVINLGTSALQDIFRKRYKTLTNSEWKSSSAKEFFERVITSDEKKSIYNNMIPDQKAKLPYVKNWDLTTLHLVLQNIDFTRNSPSAQATSNQNKENAHIKNLKDVRNKYSHLSEQIIPQKQFDDWWTQAESALLSLGVSKSEIKIARELGIIKSFQQFDSATPNFTGRKELLETLHSCLSECSTKNDFKDRIVVLCGIGGMGKTELARKYAETHLNDPIIQNVAWIDAETLSNLTDSFVSLAKKLGLLITDETKIDEIVEDVYQHFSKYIGTGLFIFDNSQEMNNERFTVYKYLPSQFLQRRPLVLITARDKTWEIPNHNIILVDILSTCETMELLIKKFQLNPALETFTRQKAALRKLADAFQGYPLGLSLATFNIHITEWTDLEDEIEIYLKRMKKPKGNWLKDKQSRAATSYPHIIEDVWEVTFNNIKNSERNGKISIELLNCMAFLPTDLITIELLQNVYEFILNKGFTRSGLSILDKYSLVRSHIETFGGVTNQRIGIHRLVQRFVREKLDHNKNCVYLSGICKYFSNLALKSRQDNLIKDALIVSHEYLKERSWPLECISFSAIFCSIFAKCSNFKDALSIALDVHQFLEKNKITKKNFKKADFRNLFMMSVFWMNFNGRFCREKIYEDPKLRRDNLENTFISLIQPSIEYVQTSKTSFGFDLVKEHCFKLCFTILENFPYYSKALQTQASDIILATVNSMSGFNFENIKEIFDLLWECCKCVGMPNSLAYIETLYKKHFQVYSSVQIGGFNDLGPLLSNYWNENGAMDFYRYLVVFQRHDDDQSGFVDSFFAAGGLRFLTHYIEFRSLNEIDSVELPLFDFIHTVAYDMNLSHKLIQSFEFMHAYHQFTNRLANLKTKSAHLKLWCIFTWFPLFARKRADFDERGNKWSIASVANEMRIILNEVLGSYWGEVKKFTHKTLVMNFMKMEVKYLEYFLLQSCQRITVVFKLVVFVK